MGIIEKLSLEGLCKVWVRGGKGEELGAWLWIWWAEGKENDLTNWNGACVGQGEHWSFASVTPNKCWSKIKTICLISNCSLKASSLAHLPSWLSTSYIKSLAPPQVLGNRRDRSSKMGEHGWGCEYERWSRASLVRSSSLLLWSASLLSLSVSVSAYLAASLPPFHSDSWL